MEANDNVNHPAHNTDGKIEVIDYTKTKALIFAEGTRLSTYRGGKEKQVERNRGLAKSRLVSE